MIEYILGAIVGIYATNEKHKSEARYKQHAKDEAYRLAGIKESEELISESLDNILKYEARLIRLREKSNANKDHLIANLEVKLKDAKYDLETYKERLESYKND